MTLPLVLFQTKRKKYYSIIDKSIDAHINALHEQGVQEDLQWLLNELFTVVFDGTNCNIVPCVEAVLGQPATDFKTYV